MSGFASPTTPNLADYAVFLANAGFRTNYLPAGSIWIPTTFNLAIETVNEDIAVASPLSYTLAVYNLATDRLINFAADVSGEDFFEKLREKYGIFRFVSGVVAAASDSGTGGSLLNQEFMRRLTMQDLKTLKTPFGQAYMEIAQDYGSNIWLLV